MVGQEPVLYARSIYENIIFGLPENVIPSREVLPRTPSSSLHWKAAHHPFRCIFSDVWERDRAAPTWTEGEQ